jgi:malonate decarboxylase beta subunit
MNASDTFSSLSAEQRAAVLLDEGTLSPLHSGGETTIWAGRGKIGGRAVLLALTDGHQRGGTVGVDEAKVLSRLTAIAGQRRPSAIVICWDTGGVRVQEGPPALAAASAVGVALTRLSLLGAPVASVISGPRGCFGAPSVIAATAHEVIVTSDAQWGLTGPSLLLNHGERAQNTVGRQATSAQSRFEHRQATTLVGDSAAEIRTALKRFVDRPLRRTSATLILGKAEKSTQELLTDLDETARITPKQSGRQRDLFRYSFRGHWRPTGPVIRGGQVHAAWGELDGRPAMGIIVGAEQSARGLGIEDAAAIIRTVRFAVAESHAEPAPIFIFVFCRGHDDQLEQERAGLPTALAECLQSLVVARLLGHPLLCVLGGGAYGAAYLSLAAPCHRILAIRGTSVAPMAPRVLTAFRRLRGIRESDETPRDLAQLIPEIRIVESVVRLPRALSEELAAAINTTRFEGPPPRRLATRAQNARP